MTGSHFTQTLGLGGHLEQLNCLWYPLVPSVKQGQMTLFLVGLCGGTYSSKALL